MKSKELELFNQQVISIGNRETIPKPKFCVSLQKERVFGNCLNNIKSKGKEKKNDRGKDSKNQ